MFELSPDTKQVTGLPETKPDSFVAPRISVEQDDSVVLTMSIAELDALTDLVLNAPSLSMKRWQNTYCVG